MPDSGVFQSLFEIIIFVIPFGDGNGTRLTHFTFNLGTLISSLKTANCFYPINLKKVLHVEFKLLQDSLHILFQSL